MLRKFYFNKVMIFVGNISYEIFLIHQLVIRYCENLLKNMMHGEFRIWIYILAGGITLLSAYLYQAIEKELKAKVRAK